MNARLIAFRNNGDLLMYFSSFAEYAIKFVFICFRMLTVRLCSSQYRDEFSTDLNDYLFFLIIFNRTNAGLNAKIKVGYIFKKNHCSSALVLELRRYTRISVKSITQSILGVP